MAREPYVNSRFDKSLEAFLQIEEAEKFEEKIHEEEIFSNIDAYLIADKFANVFLHNGIYLEIEDCIFKYGTVEQSFRLCIYTSDNEVLQINNDLYLLDEDELSRMSGYRVESYIKYLGNLTSVQ